MYLKACSEYFANAITRMFPEKNEYPILSYYRALRHENKHICEISIGPRNSVWICKVRKKPSDARVVTFTREMWFLNKCNKKAIAKKAAWAAEGSNLVTTTLEKHNDRVSLSFVSTLVVASVENFDLVAEEYANALFYCSTLFLGCLKAKYSEDIMQITIHPIPYGAECED